LAKIDELSDDQIKVYDQLLRMTTTNLNWMRVTPEQQQELVDTIMNIIHTMDEIDKEDNQPK